jgi:hypothetical protein
LGEVIRDARPRFASDTPETEFNFSGGIKAACERFVCDVLVHKDLFEHTRPRVNAYSTVYTRVASQFRQTDELRLPLDVEEAGVGIQSLGLDGCPRHVPLLRHALASLGQVDSDMHAYRITLPYPPVPMSMVFDWTRRASDSS